MNGVDNTKKKKIALLGALPDHPNKGCAALAYGALDVLSEVFPTYDIQLMNYFKINPRRMEITIAGNKQLELDIIDLRFSKNIILTNNIALLLMCAAFVRMIPIPLMVRKMYNIFPRMKAIQKTDCFFAVSGGDSFSDIYGLKRFFYVTLPYLLLTIMGKRVVFLPQTYGPYKKKVTQIVTRLILSKAEMIFSRDRHSIDEIAALYKDKNSLRRIRFCYDVAFLLKPEVPPDPLLVDGEGVSEEIIGLNVSGLLFSGGYNAKNQFGLIADYRELIFSIIDWIQELNSTTLMLVPHVFGNAAENDLDACTSVYNSFASQRKKNVLLIDTELSPGQLKWYIGNCSFFIGSRMHSCIAAISQAVACVPVAYSRKFEGIMETMDARNLVADPRKCTVTQIMDQILKSYESRETIRNTLRTKMSHVTHEIIDSLSSVHI